MNTKHPMYITVSSGLRGWFATSVHWNADMGGFYEPYQTSDCSHSTKQAAIAEAKEWAKNEGLEFIL